MKIYKCPGSGSTLSGVLLYPVSSFTVRGNKKYDISLKTGAPRMQSLKHEMAFVRNENRNNGLTKSAYKSTAEKRLWRDKLPVICGPLFLIG